MRLASTNTPVYKTVVSPKPWFFHGIKKRGLDLFFKNRETIALVGLSTPSFRPSTSVIILHFSVAMNKQLKLNTWDARYAPLYAYFVVDLVNFSTQRCMHTSAVSTSWLDRVAEFGSARYLQCYPCNLTTGENGRKLRKNGFGKRLGSFAKARKTAIFRYWNIHRPHIRISRFCNTTVSEKLCYQTRPECFMHETTCSIELLGQQDNTTDIDGHPCSSFF